MPAPYPIEFRREAVAAEEQRQVVSQLASELGVSPQSLCNWSRQIDVDEDRENLVVPLTAATAQDMTERWTDTVNAAPPPLVSIVTLTS